MRPAKPVVPILAVTVAVVVVVAALVVATTLRESSDAASPPPATEPSATGGVAPSANAEAAEILRQWDEERAAAWAAGDERALRLLYTAGSDAGAQDLAMLRQWVARGLRVEGMRMQVSAVAVVRRSERRLVLRVTDRLADAVAVRDSDGQRWTLPRDRATTRRLAFRRTSGSWLLASARAVAR